MGIKYFIMKTENFLAVVKSVKLSKSGNTYVVSVKTDDGDKKVLYASKTLGTITTTTTDENGNEKPLDVQRFSTGRAFDFSVKVNKKDDQVTDYKGDLVYEDDAQTIVKTYKDDGLSILSAEEVAFDFFKEMVAIFK
jgi:hypothetical protein